MHRLSSQQVFAIFWRIYSSNDPITWMTFKVCNSLIKIWSLFCNFFSRQKFHHNSSSNISYSMTLCFLFAWKWKICEWKMDWLILHWSWKHAFNIAYGSTNFSNLWKEKIETLKGRNNQKSAWFGFAYRLYLMRRPMKSYQISQTMTIDCFWVYIL